jgi:hypothetical protein
MEKIKHFATSLKEKVTGHDGQEHKHQADENTPVKDTAPRDSHAPVGTGHPDPPTHGHKHSNRDPPGAPGIIETPAPGVVGSGTMGPGLAPGMIPRI